MLTLEPAAYRTVKLLMRFEGILRWVDEKISALKDYLNKNIAEALSNRFVAVQAGTGLIALVDALYFLDYKQAKGFFELYAEMAGVQAPSEADWRHCQLERKYAHRLEVADHRSVMFGPQNWPPDPIRVRRHFIQTPPFCLNLRMPLKRMHRYRRPRLGASREELQSSLASGFRSVFL